MAITEACVYDVRKLSPEVQQSLGLRVLIMRRWPQGIAWSMIDVWIPDLGPSVTLLRAYNAGLVDWSTFEARYREEQDQATMCVARFRKAGQKILSLSPMQLLRNLEQQHGTVTVMCRERAGEHCHRHIVVCDFDLTLAGGNE
jgi:uncharacterized protein YeaO (DUF488 family)